jgi:hypothetical protein
VVHVSEARSHERSGGKREQSNGAKAASLGFPAFEFPAVECHRYSFLNDAK